MKKFVTHFTLLLLLYSSNAQAQSPELEKLQEILRLINTRYSGSLDAALADSIAHSIVSNLDPHSAYFTKKEIKEFKDQLQSGFEGIGIGIIQVDDTFFIKNIIPGGPAEKAGLLAGDRLLNIDSTPVAATGKSIVDVIGLLKGIAGTLVKITILRYGQKKPQEYFIIRDKVHINTMNAVYMATPSTGYIRFSYFSETSATEFNKAATLLKKQGAKNLVLDLTGNAGGYLKMGVTIADEFIDGNQLLVAVGRDNAPKQEYLSTDTGIWQTGNVAVLIDEYTASSAEVLAGALQDLDRALLIGQRSYGKGLVQDIFDLADGSAVKLTTGSYFTPSGRCIQKNFSNKKQYHAELESRIKTGELIQEASVPYYDTTQYYTRNRRLLFGSGGIVPDIFVPVDSYFLSTGYNQFEQEDFTDRFLIRYLDGRRTSLLRLYPDAGQFAQHFTATDYITAFTVFVKEKNDPTGKNMLTMPKAMLQTFLNASLARHLYNSDNAFYSIFNQHNNLYKKALECFNNGAFRKLQSRD